MATERESVCVCEKEKRPLTGMDALPKEPDSTGFLQKPGILTPGPGIQIPVLVFYWMLAKTWDSRPWPKEPDSCTRFLLDSCENLGFSTLAQGSRFL